MCDGNFICPTPFPQCSKWLDNSHIICRGRGDVCKREREDGGGGGEREREKDIGYENGGFILNDAFE